MKTAHYFHDIKGVRVQISQLDKDDRETLMLMLVDANGKAAGTISIFFDGSALIAGYPDMEVPAEWQALM